jgi:hypothetical protein
MQRLITVAVVLLLMALNALVAKADETIRVGLAFAGYWRERTTRVIPGTSFDSVCGFGPALATSGPSSCKGLGSTDRLSAGRQFGRVDARVVPSREYARRNLVNRVGALRGCGRMVHHQNARIIAKGAPQEIIREAVHAGELAEAVVWFLWGRRGAGLGGKGHGWALQREVDALALPTQIASAWACSAAIRCAHDVPSSAWPDPRIPVAHRGPALGFTSRNSRGVYVGVSCGIMGFEFPQGTGSATFAALRAFALPASTTPTLPQ